MRRLLHFICPARYGLCIFCDFHRLFMIFLVEKDGNMGYTNDVNIKRRF